MLPPIYHPCVTSEGAMCGRYTLRHNPRKIAKRFNVDEFPELGPPRFNTDEELDQVIGEIKGILDTRAYKSHGATSGAKF